MFARVRRWCRNEWLLSGIFVVLLVFLALEVVDQERDTPPTSFEQVVFLLLGLASIPLLLVASRVVLEHASGPERPSEPVRPVLHRPVRMRWVGEARDTAAEAFADAREHSPNVRETVERPVG